MSLGHADTGGGLRWVPRVLIILAAIVLVVLVLAPMARANASSIDGVVPGSSANESVRPRDGCFTTFRDEQRQPTAIRMISTRPGADAERPGLAVVGTPERLGWQRSAGDVAGGPAALGPCGQPAPFDPYGLGSLLWRGPDWGDPALGHRT